MNTITETQRTVWRDFAPQVLEREYSPSSCIDGNYQPFIAAYGERSRQARAAYQGRSFAYGELPSQTLDLFLPQQFDVVTPSPVPPPLLVFIHGGYWQELSKNESLFAATDCLEQNIAFAALDYTLAPKASVFQIMEECRAALKWLFDHAQNLGFDNQRIIVAGSSAGAHLAALCAIPAAQLQSKIESIPIKAAVLVSGIYDLRPLLNTSINAALGLDDASAVAVSPALMSVEGFPPSIVCWGDNETNEFKRQSRAFAKQLEGAGVVCRAFEIADRNHFNIILDLADSASQLGRAVISLISTNNSDL